MNELQSRNLYMTNDYGAHWTLLHRDGATGIRTDTAAVRAPEDSRPGRAALRRQLQGAYGPRSIRAKHWRTCS